MKSSFELWTLIVTLKASSSANEETPPTMAGMRETEGTLPPIVSAALFWLPSGALLLCPGSSIVARGVSITFVGAVVVLAAGVTNTTGVGAGAFNTSGVGAAAT